MSGRTAPIALEAAITKSILGAPTLAYGRGERSSHHAALFYDLIEFEAGLDRAKMAFGEGFLHCMAIKSNPISAILKIVLEKGHGIECASIGEVLHGLDIGFPPDRIVFDSPVKTVSELKFSLERGIFINVDNFQELEVITELRKEIKHTESTVGLRLKPIIGTGDVKALSVCTPDSKFGVALTDLSREQIISWFVERPWLKGVHIHIGSQSFDCASLCRGVKSIIDFALEVNQRVGRNQVEVIDIGGGLNVNRQDDTVRPSFQEYAEDLKKNVPELFPDCGVFKKVITEFGQALNAKAGWLASRVEYTKMLSDDLKLALTHFGADMMMRTCYCPDTPKYQRRVQVFENNGKPKEGKKCYHNIAGPLCFSGDVIKRSVLLPEIERGDFVVLHDCGANSLSTFSRHCSRFAPAVIGYRVQQDGTVNFRVLKEMETLEDLKIFWGGRKQEENSEW